MNKLFNIVIIGSGNVAHHMAHSFSKKNNLQLVQVFNHRKTKIASDLAKAYTCKLVTDYNKLNTGADLYIICVKDEAIPEVVKNLVPLKLGGIVVHTSGSIDLSVLENTSKKTGVYYPLQTFSKDAEIKWKHTPILIEATTTSTLSELKKIASSISDTVKTVSSKDRLKLHLAAVFACNFTNALYAAAYDLIETDLSQKDTRLLKPVMLQSFSKLERMHPKKAQTGPAIRNDKIVMKKHLDLLRSNKELAATYKLLSDLIIKQQH